MHFSEIIKHQSGKECHTLLCILKLFTNINDYAIFKKCMVTPNFFLILIELVETCFFGRFSKPRKNTFELVGAVLQ